MGSNYFLIANHIIIVTSYSRFMSQEKWIGNILNLVWGIRSIYYNKTENIDNTLDNIEKILLEKNYLSKNDKYIITSSMPNHWKGHTNMMKMNIADL